MTPGFRLDTPTATTWLAVPEPALREEVRELYEGLVPYCTYHVVERPLGLTEPPSVAEVGPTTDAEPVTKIRRCGSRASRSTCRGWPPSSSSTRRWAPTAAS